MATLEQAARELVGEMAKGATAFHGLFAMAVLDAFWNGPRLAPWLSALLLLVSVLAVAGSTLHDKGWLAFVGAELLWALAFAHSARAQALVRKQAAAEAAKAATRKPTAVAAVPAEVPGLPPKALDFMKRMVDMFKQNATGSTNCVGQPWKLLDNQGGVQIYQSDFPGHSCKFWKVEAEIQGDMALFKRQIFDYQVRAAWDPALSSGRIIKSFPQVPGLGEPCLLQVLTAPQAGGMVSPRELVDFGVMLEEAGTFLFANASVPAELTGLFSSELPSKPTGVRAFGHVGSGSLIEPLADKPGMFRYVLVNALDLGGWLSASLINTATTGALMDGTKELLVQLDKARDRPQ